MANAYPEDNQTYLAENNVPELVEYIIQNIITNKPLRPAAFVSELLSKPIPPRIIIEGLPASGKGTQCDILVEKLGVLHISSGALLREEIASQSELGIQAESFTKGGTLVPDHLITQIVRNRLQQPDAQEKGWILDGFPRTVAQAQILRETGFFPQIMILLDIPDETVLERIEGRRLDPQTGTTYHLIYNPPPTDDEALWGRLVHRADDTREAVEMRLKQYHAVTEELFEYYHSVLERIDGTRKPEEIGIDVVKAVMRRQLV